jgi:hypothetical protein
MKIQIRQRGLKITKTQRSKLEARIGFVLARFGQRIDRVIVRFSDADGVPGYKRCQLEVGVNQLVSVEHSDIDIFLALEHAATRASRSVGRAIEKQAWSRRP